MRKDNLVIISLLLIITIVCLYLRIIPLYSYVLPEGWVRFLGTDSWYHIRIIENLVNNFPIINKIDPYLLYPNAMGLGNHHFFDFLCAGIIKLIDSNNIQIVSAYIPPVLATLTIIPSFFIGKALFNKWVGLITACLVVFMSSEFLGRSLIGSLDHHVLEVLLSTTLVLFIILALKSDGYKERLYAVLAGIIFAFYLNTWIGSLLFIFILITYIILQFVINYIRNIKSDKLSGIFLTIFLVALTITCILPRETIQMISLMVSVVIIGVFYVINAVFNKFRVKPLYYLLSLFWCGILVLSGISIIDKSILVIILNQFGVLVPEGTRLTIEEASSILFPNGQFSLAVVWISFTTGSFLSMLALYYLIKSVVKKWDDSIVFLIIWSVIVLLLTLSMRRFAYYFTINVAILSAYSSYLIVNYFWANKEVLRKKHQKRDSHIMRRSFGIIFVFMLAVFPNIVMASKSVNVQQFAPTNAWQESMVWLRDNGHKSEVTYENVYKVGSLEYKGFLEWEKICKVTDLNFNALYPYDSKSNYGVIAQWDYGYWISQIAQRAPSSNPGITENRGSISKFFISQNENTELKPEYTVMTYETAMPFLKYYSFLKYANVAESDYYDFLIQPNNNVIMMFYPKYYQSLAVRLYNFECKEIKEEGCIVVRFIEKDGYKYITESKQFTTYKEASAYISKFPSNNYRIGSVDPFRSCISIEEVRTYELAYRSKNRVKKENSAELIPEVKIYARK